MNIKNFSLLLVLVNVMVLSAQPAQQEVVVVSDKVGEEIDAEERARYALFPAVEDFISAKFIRTAPGELVLQIVSGESGHRVTQNISVAPMALRNIGTIIDAQEDGQLGTGEEAPPKPKMWRAELLQAIRKEKREGPQPFAGYLGSLFGGFLTVVTVAEMGMDIESRQGFYFSWGIGSAFVSALTINGLGIFGKDPAMFGSTFVGSLLGSALGILLIEGSSQTQSGALVVFSVLFAKPILTSWGGIKGYYGAAERRARSKPYGLLNFGGDAVGLAWPQPAVAVSPGTGKYDRLDLMYRVRLLNLKF
ncbi:hypothetical protein IIA29_12180 [candidate division KSB1 bacterium]|nr:hypothetical protein [candidate division KSB1 bacterium]